ncbi:hypothetical protein OSB04_019435 [Centaurea solstitialis]|uniref:Integrase catalytic domain-containing protein n=1 Tax=Centaurea solstitialis TaxID=347529 RepID=A0AA38W2W8_9ASTR|nr:hypothetical protein OSB04_019435 [Centaurea solstitialis]
MNQVSYVDGLKHNLISVSQLCDTGLDMMFKIKFHILYKADTLIKVKKANRRGDLYLICFDTLETKNEIYLVSSMKNEEACEMGKLRRSSHKTKSDPSYDKPLQMLHVDLCGPISVQSLGGKKYILVLIDEFTRFTWVEFVRKKSQVPLILINLLKRLQVLHGFQVRVVRSDNGTEFKNSVIEDYLASVGITHNFSALRTPQHNGVVVRKNRTLVEAAKTMLNASGLPLTFWAEAVFAACYTQNRSFVVKRFEKTPDHLLHNKRPNIKFFHVIEDKFTGELKTQAEKSPNATITQDLEKLFNEWFKNEDDPDRTSANPTKTSVEQHPATEASPFSTTISRPKSSNTRPIVSPPPEADTSNSTSVLSSTQAPITTEPIPPPSEDTHYEPIPPHASDPASQSHILQEINSTINLPHAIKWTKDHPQSQIIGEPSDVVKTRATANYCLFSCFVSEIEPKRVAEALAYPFWVKAMQDELLWFERNHV